MKNHHQNRLCGCVSAVFSMDPPYFEVRYVQFLVSYIITLTLVCLLVFLLKNHLQLVVCRCCCSFSHDFSFYIRYDMFNFEPLIS
ncbi:hypothetical protein Hanom_Chr09g00802641 [Helianthus anomalus]